MKRTRLFFLLFLMLSLAGFTPGTAAAAENTYSIDGIVQFYKAEDIIVLLLNEQEFNGMAQNSYQLILKPDKAALDTGELPFHMSNVPAGAYVLLAYQDINNSKKLDKNFLSFSEPWGTFRPQRPGMGFGLNFKDLVFNLSHDLKNIQIRLTR